KALRVCLFDGNDLIRIVLRGARSVATDAEPTAPGMPSYGWQLDDGQVAAVLTYVRNTWGARRPPCRGRPSVGQGRIWRPARTRARARQARQLAPCPKSSRAPPVVAAPP